MADNKSYHVRQITYDMSLFAVLRNRLVSAIASGKIRTLATALRFARNDKYLTKHDIKITLGKAEINTQ
ncbi:hypothetical protein OSCI_1630034 [Kamptonema sp. PCC 6506]|nr:hypothetical protein OSCI_1630034 [Kamptonema sp. PCC 6506]